jgi:hypothetical protein
MTESDIDNKPVPKPKSPGPLPSETKKPAGTSGTTGPKGTGGSK